jgi:hypothetical protein
MPDSPLNESLYKGLFYIGLKRFVLLILPPVLEQIRDESPAKWLSEESYCILHHNFLTLNEILHHKVLVEYKVPPELVTMCESARDHLRKALVPFIRDLRQDAKDTKDVPWKTVLSSRPEKDTFVDRYYDHLKNLLVAIAAIRGYLKDVERTLGSPKLIWNEHWHPTIPYPKIL